MRTFGAAFAVGSAMTIIVAYTSTSNAGGPQSQLETIAQLGTAGQSVAESGAQSRSDTTLTTDELRQLLTGKTVVFSGGGHATYFSDGRYRFESPGNSRVSEGNYWFKDGYVCVDFYGANRRCDRYVKNGNEYNLINRRGRSFRAHIR